LIDDTLAHINRQSQLGCIYFNALGRHFYPKDKGMDLIYSYIPLWASNPCFWSC